MRGRLVKRAGGNVVMLAVLNTLALSLMDLHGVPNVARQIQRFVSHPDEALTWVR